MKSDIEIAQEAKMKPITEIAASLGLADEDVIPYAATRPRSTPPHPQGIQQGKMVLSRPSAHPAGEGKPPPAWAWPMP